jgi:1-aminocyclopropane-1-carboxylate deaminase
LTPLQEISNHPGQKHGIRLFIKRDDLVHPTIQGNKWRKLHLLLENLRFGKTDKSWQGIVTFGGAFSNHLHAVAAAGKANNFPTIGIIRGKYVDLDNPTLAFAQAQGMILHPIDKRAYDAKSSPAIDDILALYPNFYQLPEGGSTEYGVEGCKEISVEIIQQLRDFDLPAPYNVCVPAGTGCTAAGVTLGLGNNGKTHVFQAATKGVSKEDMDRFFVKYPTQITDYQFIEKDYTFGGFARLTPELRGFIDQFKSETGILLDPIYTGKMMFGIFELMEFGYFGTNAVVVALHTGGLQGWNGIHYLEKK